MTVVVNEQFAAEALCVDDEATRTIRPQPDDLANDAITRDLHGREMALRVEGKRGARGNQCSARRCGATQKITSIDRCTPSRLRRLRRFTRLRNVGNTVAMTAFPEWLVPMAATLTQERFSGPDWIFERKFDGIRLLAYKKGNDVQLFSRNHLPQDLPAIQHAIERLPHEELILDGEITWRGGKLAYHVFDIMWLDGRNVTTLPLEERRDLLAKLPFEEPLHRVDFDRRSVAVGMRAARRLGRRDREASRLDLRTSPLERVAENEVRVVAKFSCRWFHGSAGETSRSRRASRWSS